MGPEEGKKVWGAQEWRRIVSRVRSGAIWNEAIQTYGEEGRVDGDVVNTLYALPCEIILSMFICTAPVLTVLILKRHVTASPFAGSNRHAEEDRGISIGRA